MPSSRGQLPSSWTAYERGRADSADSSLDPNRVSFNETAEQHHERHSETLLNPYAAPGEGAPELRKRRSSVNMALRSIREAGGVNSLDNFARSWQRAAGFHEVTPVRQSFRYSEDQDASGQGDEEEGDTPKTQRSLLRQQLEAQRGLVSDDAVTDDDRIEATVPMSRRTTRDQDQQMSDRMQERESLLSKTTSHPRDDSIFMIEPSLASPFGGSYGSTWGSLSSRVNESSMRHAGRLFRQQQMQGIAAPDKEREPLLVKQVEDDDGKVLNIVVGQSTLPQTIFNSVNVLIGVGLLALPLAMRYAGWVPGLIFFFFAGASTCYTAKLLAKCADVDSSLITFADLAYVSFGLSARIATSILFSLELLAACVALVVLFADSLSALTPELGWDPTAWKIVCGVILIPLSFLPLRFLSFTSILGILSCFGIVVAVIIDGLIKPHTPGSLREPAQTYLFPSNWGTLPIAFGILMSPWGGHSVFPNIYRDMRHPYKYRKGVNVTYSFVFSLDLLMAVVGLLMFGDGVKDEVTRNILSSTGYPVGLSVFIVICVAIIPLTKIPLNARPIVATIELFMGLDVRAMGDAASTHGMSGLVRGILKIAVRISCLVCFVLLAILVPEFDTIMSLLGAVACFTICLILPCAFHLKLFGKELSWRQKALDWTLIVVSTILAVVSTGFNFVPKSRLGL